MVCSFMAFTFLVLANFKTYSAFVRTDFFLYPFYISQLELITDNWLLITVCCGKD